MNIKKLKTMKNYLKKKKIFINPIIESNLKPGDSNILSSKLGEEIAAVVIDDIISSQSSNNSLLRSPTIRLRNGVIPALAGQTLPVRSREVYTRAIVGK